MLSKGTKQTRSLPIFASKSSERRQHGWHNRKRNLKSALTVVLALFPGFYITRAIVEAILYLFRPIVQDSDWNSHREEVKDVFVTSWDAYSKHAWGKSGCFVVSNPVRVKVNTN